MTLEEQWMLRAFALAEKGMGRVSPNPLVGCVIVHNQKIIGEGWHRRYGEAHAEVNAVAAVADHALLQHSTVYVNLEPCAHHGKTPPCADMLIDKRVKAVVIANTDPNPLVNGRGIERLRAAGISVAAGVLEAEGRNLNRRFFTFMEQQRPYVILKWAQTEDGFIAKENYESKWISNEWSRQWVHRWRTEEDAVLVGARTAACDNPQLNVRDWTGRDPVRVVIDRHLKLPPTLHLFSGPQPTLCYNLLKSETHGNCERVCLGASLKTPCTPSLLEKGEGVEVIKARFLEMPLDESDFLGSLLRDLFSRKIQSVMVEGGAFTLQQFIDRRLWDEARVFECPVAFGSGIPAPLIRGRQTDEFFIANDRLRRLVPNNP
jgi:diaminohydroxyphosphoribosylaminopyrimidine deaminase/5-amino-6-(5-phosphoribosylamino)uracil reductase